MTDRNAGKFPFLVCQRTGNGTRTKWSPPTNAYYFGTPGVEPGLNGPKPIVLPLYYVPLFGIGGQKNHSCYYSSPEFRSWPAIKTRASPMSLSDILHKRKYQHAYPSLARREKLLQLRQLSSKTTPRYPCPRLFIHYISILVTMQFDENIL